MPLLQPASNMQAYLKLGIRGFQGSGKSFTAAMVAIGLAQRDKGHRPVAFFDTENGADYLIPKFQAAGIQLSVAKTRAFVDLLAVVKEAEGSCSVLIVDSITHIWRDLVESFKKRRKVTRMEFQHWDVVKTEWGQWTDMFLNSSIHVIVCGRAGYEYEYEKDDDGHKELVKTGIKMKVENEFGYEPSVLVEMERVPQGGAEAGVGWVHRCHVLKDRTDTIDGKMFDNPTLADFEPVLASLSIGGKQLAIDATRDSTAMFDSADWSRTEDRRERQIALEEIEETCKMLWPGQTKEEKLAKGNVIDALFGTRSWTAVQEKPRNELRIAARALRLLETELTTTERDNIETVLAKLVRCHEQAKIGDIPLSEAEAFGGIDSPEPPTDAVPPDAPITADELAAVDAPAESPPTGVVEGVEPSGGEPVLLPVEARSECAKKKGWFKVGTVNVGGKDYGISKRMSDEKIECACPDKDCIHWQVIEDMLAEEAGG